MVSGVRIPPSALSRTHSQRYQYRYIPNSKPIIKPKNAMTGRRINKGGKIMVKKAIKAKTSPNRNGTPAIIPIIVRPALFVG